MAVSLSVNKIILLLDAGDHLLLFLFRFLACIQLTLRLIVSETDKVHISPCLNRFDSAQAFPANVLNFASLFQCICYFLLAIKKRSTHWQSKWKAAGQRSQQSRSPPSLQLSQQSWLTARPCLRCSAVRFLRLDRRAASSLIGGATSFWICWK